jgi:protein-tyrosine phosphatase
MRSILFVCTANLCRSPCAEAVFRTLLAKSGLSGAIHVDSAGTHASMAGHPPFPLAAQEAARRGYDVSECVARQIGMGDFDRFDMILVMDKKNLAQLRRIVPSHCKSKIELLLEYGDKYYGREVPDPIGAGAPAFKTMLDMVEDGCRGLTQLMARAA